MMQFFNTVVIAGTVVTIAFMVLLAIPNCKLREIVMPFISWAFVALCGIYAISPVDVMPEVVLGPLGLFDDAAAVVIGLGTAVSTIKAQREKRAAAADPTRN